MSDLLLAKAIDIQDITSSDSRLSASNYSTISITCIFITDDTEGIYSYSSGIVKLNFKSEQFKYYCLAFLKDNYFLKQLDCLTPRGSTLRHAGEKFLDCLIPLPNPTSNWVFHSMEHLIKNIAYSEYLCYKKTADTVGLIDTELMVHPITYSYPSISQLATTKRLDAAIYSPEVQALFENIRKYKHDNSSLDDFGFGLKRGPNLAKRDLGRSIQSSTYKKGFNVLIYPSDISDGTYILQSSYIGARNPVWFLKVADILFAAEGTVGKTFIICSEDMRFTTNFHGTIISPHNKDSPLVKSIFLGQFLNYLRLKGIFAKLAVGGQGGSFALGYWDTIRIPLFPDNLISSISTLYHSPCFLDPLTFNQKNIEAAGIFQLNEFRILCKSILDMICSDIKLDVLKSRNYYSEFTEGILSDDGISSSY